MSEIERIVKRATADALNEMADQVAALSGPEVPISVGGGTLRASAIYPANDGDGSHTATEEHLEAIVSYNTVYAAAQHEGDMTYERNGHIIHWVVKEHTEPGTKTHYLEDPYKAFIPRMEPYLGAKIREALDRAKLL